MASMEEKIKCYKFYMVMATFHNAERTMCDIMHFSSPKLKFYKEH